MAEKKLQEEIQRLSFRLQQVESDLDEQQRRRSELPTGEVSTVATIYWDRG